MFNPKKISQYFIGLLLVPWIWAIGVYVIILVFLAFYRSAEDFMEVSLNVKQNLDQAINLTPLTAIAGIILILNYSISFFTAKKYPKLVSLLFLSTMFLLLCLLLFAWPHFQRVLLSS